jgi:putative FmdB family regulatory protein
MQFFAFSEREMPIYEYRCESCGHQQEFLQKVSDAPHTTCPKCGKPSLSKMLSAAGFQLKGSGWYATDFKGGATKPAAKPDDAKSGGDKPAGESKSEEKKAAPSPGAGGSANG